VVGHSGTWGALCSLSLPFTLTALTTKHNTGVWRGPSLSLTSSYSSYPHGRGITFFFLWYCCFLRTEPVCSVGRAFRDNFFLFPRPLPPPVTCLLTRKYLNWPIAPTKPSFFMCSGEFSTQKASTLLLSTMLKKYSVLPLITVPPFFRNSLKLYILSACLLEEKKARCLYINPSFKLHSTTPLYFDS
jgi:hypothetical protein